MPDIYRLLYFFPILILTDIIFPEFKIIDLHGSGKILDCFPDSLQIKEWTGINTFFFNLCSQSFQEVVLIDDPTAVLIETPEIIPVFIAGFIVARALGIPEYPIKIFAAPAV